LKKSIYAVTYLFGLALYFLEQDAFPVAKVRMNNDGGHSCLDSANHGGSGLSRLYIARASVEALPDELRFDLPPQHKIENEAVRKGRWIRAYLKPL
jgi:hypothetical protein